MIIPVEHGKSKETFGGGQEEDDLQTPLVDITVPPGMTQEGVLKDYDLRTWSRGPAPRRRPRGNQVVSESAVQQVSKSASQRISNSASQRIDESAE